MIHELKIFTDYFADVIKGEKTFEIRKNDRPYKKGDMLALNEYDGQAYTGNSCLVYIDYILSDPEYVKKDMVVMAIKPCSVFRHSDMRFEIDDKRVYTVPYATTNRVAEGGV